MLDPRLQLSAADLAPLLERAEADAYADLLRAAPAEWRCAADCTDGTWLLLAPPLDILLFNRVIGAGVHSPAREDDVLAWIDRYRRAGVRNFGVQVCPAAKPIELRTWLARAGLRSADRWTKVYRSNDPVAAPATDVQGTRVGHDDAPTFAAVTTDGFGMPATLRPWLASTVGRPGWRHYLAWHERRAIAGAALFVNGEVGWLGIASTVPAARRRGAQAALMARRLEDGRALGCRWFVTETGEELPGRPNPSFHNMMRAGFAVAYARENYLAVR